MVQKWTTVRKCLKNSLKYLYSFLNLSLILLQMFTCPQFKSFPTSCLTHLLPELSIFKESIYLLIYFFVIFSLVSNIPNTMTCVLEKDLHSLS